uniref:Uncharacterized protein n=1 Tax=Lactuca sativa TaxID=4236 RepID=A0A9R1W299_LACSA|nr:hypothetical protein LSAT_V11C300103710 [Lactuca sativa]
MGMIMIGGRSSWTSGVRRSSKIKRRQSREGGLLPCALYLLEVLCEYVICMSLNLIISLLVMQTSHLEALLEPIGARVRSYYVSQSGGAIPKDTFIAIAIREAFFRSWDLSWRSAQGLSFRTYADKTLVWSW